LASLALVVLDRSEAPAASGIKALYEPLSTGDVFYEAPGSIHLPSRCTSITKPARILALAFAEKGKEITKLL
jgi:hypothetical protein